MFEKRVRHAVLMHPVTTSFSDFAMQIYEKRRQNARNQQEKNYENDILLYSDKIRFFRFLRWCMVNMLLCPAGAESYLWAYPWRCPALGSYAPSEQKFLHAKCRVRLKGIQRYQIVLAP